jgi:hypothetical protein
MIGIVDQTGKRLKHEKVGCKLKQVVKVLAPYRARLKNVAVESTYNWYWLVDGLRALSYPIRNQEKKNRIESATAIRVRSGKDRNKKRGQ